jgi:hypothetical protein
LTPKKISAHLFKVTVIVPVIAAFVWFGHIQGEDGGLGMAKWFG